jgi:uncharacterized protein YggE
MWIKRFKNEGIQPGMAKRTAGEPMNGAIGCHKGVIVMRVRYIITVMAAICMFAGVAAAEDKPAQADPKGICVSGVGTVQATPDSATFLVTAEVLSEGKARPVPEQFQVLKKVVEALRGQGIGKDSIWITWSDRHRVRPTQQGDGGYSGFGAGWVDSKGQRRFSGGPDMPEVRVTVQKLSGLRAAISAAEKSGGDPIENVALGVSDGKKLAEEALSVAVVDAKAQAIRVAGGLNRVLGPAVSASPNWYDQPPQTVLPAANALAGIETGLMPKLDIARSVRVVYEIR